MISNHRRYKGGHTFYIRADDERDAYDVRIVRNRVCVWKGTVNAPRFKDVAFDSPAAIARVVDAALAFSDDDGADVYNA